MIGNGRETQDYTYNIRGWLTNTSGDYFNEHLYYETKRDASAGCFNGNISQQDISYRAGGYDALVPLQFDNTYDQLNRLTGSGISGDSQRFGENVSYDKHGNITSHQRSGIKDHNWTSGSVPSPDHEYSSIDLMSYTYIGNQVETISDSGSDALYTGAQDFKNNASTSDEYDYDANGNMTKDLNKEIVPLSYNSLNLPDTLQLKDGHMVSYVYDASGRKEQVTRVTMITSGITIPVGSTLKNANLGTVSTSKSYTKYASNVVYNDTHISSILLPDGILIRTNALTTNPPVFSYNHYVRDHLGNVRTVIDNAGAIKQVNNYYPFGMEYGESAEDQSKLTYQDYLYSGKEFDRKFEVNLYDFGARFYDATRSQWTTPDPLAEKYYSISPYAYCANNPIRFIDPDGMRVETGSMTKDEQREYDKMIALLSKSDLFKTLYSTLVKSDNVYKISFGQTDKDKSGNSVPGDFRPNSKTDGGSVTFLKGSNLNSLATTEELAHAYQNENKTLDNKNINPEFEAKTMTQLVASDAGIPYGQYGGMGEFQDQLLTEYNNTLTPRDVNSSGFQASYKNAALLYSAYNRTNNIGNSHYRQLTLQQPATLMKLVNNAFLKNMLWIK